MLGYVSMVKDTVAFWEVEVVILDTISYCYRLVHTVIHVCIFLLQLLVYFCHRLRVVLLGSLLDFTSCSVGL